MMTLFVDLTGCCDNPAFAALCRGVALPANRFGVLRKAERRFLHGLRVESGKGPECKETGVLTWPRRWTPNSAAMPVNRGDDDSLQRRRSRDGRQQPDDGNPNENKGLHEFLQRAVYSKAKFRWYRPSQTGPSWGYYQLGAALGQIQTARSNEAWNTSSLS